METFDIAVIGSGPGGYVAAIRASQLGKKVVIIEKEHLGGVCLNWGCIPTKALLRSAEIKHLCEHASSFGIEVGEIKINLDEVVKRSRRVSAQLSGGIKALLQKNKVAVISGHASLGQLDKDRKTIIVKNGALEQKIISQDVIIATGARAKTLPNIPNHKNIWYAKQAMTPEFLPSSLLIIGSGAIGIEFASFYQTLGSKVTVVEMQPRILPQEDLEISDMAKKFLEKAGIKFFLSSTTDQITTSNGQVNVKIKDKDGVEHALTFDAVIVAVGITGNVEDFGLEKTKIKVEKGQIKVNEWCETEEPGIYAIGDVAGAPWLAHKASHEGIMVAEKIAKLPVHPLNKNNIPSCTYSMPQVASVGLTEEKAKTMGYNLKVGRFPYRGNGKAMALGETEGLIKTIFDAKTGELLGAHMIGAEVTELIHSLILSKTLETTEAELIHTIFPHPTLSEMLHESVLNAYDRTIHY